MGRSRERVYGKRETLRNRARDGELERESLLV